MKNAEIKKIFSNVEKNIPEALCGDVNEYRYIAPWLFIRNDKYKSLFLNDWYMQKFGFSRSRLLRDIILKKAPVVRLACSVECIFYKKSSIRYFERDQHIVYKIFLDNGIRDLESFHSDIQKRKDFAQFVETVKVLDYSQYQLVEEISTGIRVLEQNFVKNKQYQDRLKDTALKIIKHSLETSCAIQGGTFQTNPLYQYVDAIEGETIELLTAKGHGDFQIHNLFWNEYSQNFILIDWECVDRYPIFWDSYLFFIMLLNKNKIQRSSRLMMLATQCIIAHFNFIKDELKLVKDDAAFQIKACEKIYWDRFGETELKRYGKDRLVEKIKALRLIFEEK